VVGLFVQGLAFALPISTYIFRVKRRMWHEAYRGAAA